MPNPTHVDRAPVDVATVRDWLGDGGETAKVVIEFCNGELESAGRRCIPKDGRQNLAGQQRARLRALAVGSRQAG